MVDTQYKLGELMRDVLESLARGEISVAEAERRLRVLALEEIGDIARLDTGRELRKGIPEIVLAEGKTPEAVRDIVLAGAKRAGRIIISRAGDDYYRAIEQATTGRLSLESDTTRRTIVVRRDGYQVAATGGQIGILTGGTSDIPVAEEARIVAEEMGCEVTAAYDVGVAGIHRLFGPLKEMIERDTDVVVVIAGREGALATVVAGLVDIPVIGVPTSQSWGLGEKGLSALTAMLQACPLGLTVVNIDGGVAAGAAAALIANRAAAARKSPAGE
jgi:NCAIR mutase (PurE)-related protein